MTLRAGDIFREGDMINESERDATPANDEDKLVRLGPDGMLNRNFLHTLDVQEFTADGTWEKPEHGQFAIVELWAAGGAGGAIGPVSYAAAAGGAGGQYHIALIPLAFLGATETVTVGEGGQTNGADGGDTSFGSWVSADGGVGGTTASNGSTASVPGGSTGVDGFHELKDEAGANGGGANATQFTGSASNGGDKTFAGASGGGAASTTYGAQEFTGTGGSSTYGGDGGDGASPVTPGDQYAEDGATPGGGGGGIATRYGSITLHAGKGGDGFARITVI